MKMWFLISHLVTVCFVFCLAEDGKGYGPVFEEQPIDTIYPEESTDGQVSMNCRARAIPFPTYKWKLNNWDIDLTKDRYSIVGGRLLINHPEKSKDAGKYVCIASNIFGTVRSTEATLSFGYLDTFPPEERYEVKVREGVGAVLLCEPPYHSPDDLSYRWLLNEFPVFITLDKRRFVSQTNGNLYIANVEASDRGNYSCFVSSPSITKSVFSKFIPLIPQAVDRSKVYPADIKVTFKDTYALLGQNVTLECFALGNPVPEIRWNKYLEPMPATAEISMSGAVLKILNIQFEDEGTYECEAENYKGKDKHQARVYVQAYPEWVEHINDTERDIGSDLYWPCVATGRPTPTIRWLKNGVSFRRGELRIQSLTVEDAGMYQCIAENVHGIIYANAELKVVASPPNFELNPMKKKILAAKGGRVIIECKPKAAPKPKFSWSKGTELLVNGSRISIWDDGSLEIVNITKLDQGSYTCFAENNRGKANSTGTLEITEATKITLAPTNVDVTVGENATMQCIASYDTTLDLTFIWSLNGYMIDFEKEHDHYERSVMIKNNGEMRIKNVQLQHAGRYTCTAQTIVDNSSASADLIVRGPPGPPGGLRIEDIKDTSVTLTWSRGTDNHSPISKYTIQSKTFLSEEWKDSKTDPPNVEGNMETAKVIDLIPWMEYEFRITAMNTLGTGEPSMPSQRIRTEGAAPNVAPSDVGGGGGSNRELTITWMPLSREYHFGKNFGYIVAFKPFGEKEWRRVTVTNPDIGRYVHKDDSLPPSTKFQVKVKAFNNKGDGPFSLVAIIYSAQDAPTEQPRNVNVKVLSSSEISVSWEHVFEQSVEGYQIRYWTVHDKEAAAQRVLVSSQDYSTKLENLKPSTRYHVDVSAYNSAGYGPPSVAADIITRKAPPSQRPRIISTVRSGSRYIITWDHVTPKSNESAVQGYKVLYRPDGQHEGTLYSTGTHSIELPVPRDGEYIVEVRAHSEGGDGEVAQIKISGAAGVSPGLLGLLLTAIGVLAYLEF
ncbi:contactin-1 isoform X1 [Gopherus evgoodei]|uniref:Contactin-1 n=1 Tax=Gopherus agassizii TaxID=38772 RepID=A0A452H469_9SAUR|nr:contactin-1 isoform X1 [Gopherus evgoodei]XP_030404821.1 contactin-1 isoform X1 [Gopherus evgoodei]XP_030404822.1 contactin-1 isoform X1 [Gopherus evgoodei]XP_030404823.1 contactin-1 isoform X1 [Gopherus evgoodei]